MPKDHPPPAEPFGPRLARLRKAAGFTQEELAEEIGVTRRMVAYYEVESEYPPSSLLPQISRALKVSTDELLGVIPIKKDQVPGNARLHRRLQQIDKLAMKDKRQVLQLLDAFVERAQYKRQASG
jgi:transcriptional regulator with XRE-family HTH domain